ncbi:DHA2 family efflux MFS transporter permease subunit [Candidatus Thiothrix sp. Deng01]|uniref:DHA2 family efflux MFS transporter permease subunit n=1 Tax=Candidatus Thiothrix phosphatis TaxID=3112415 RepID=A0ABU6D1F1_9GAMM|nr:DHA2 family efflux MFS transporter permease subunit [Candidatus Thiothrix sp. Deng01]MEB4592850.1 DHA2 family efflux MFS transporter permease subunit [Candidatus Thiothrix sp. Deng01]
MSAAANPPQPRPMSAGTLALSTLVLGLGSFMNILDLSIANVSVPSIAGDLAVSYTQGTWVITSYAVSEAIMLPLTGWLVLRFGQVRMFVMATLLFTLASMLCGLAPSFEVLVAARVLQGMVGASMIPLSQTLLTAIYPPHQRGLALGMWSMTTVLAPVVGPLAGGWLTENLSWHWVFLVNLPVGLSVALLANILVKDYESPRRTLPVDYVGLALLACGVGAMQIVLDKGNELDWFESPFIVALACVSVVALSLFIAWELTEEHPIVDLRLFARRNFLVGAVCLMVGSMAFFGIVVTLPLWLQSFQGYTPLWAGKVVAFGGMLALLMGPIVGANIHRVDARAIATFGFVVAAGVSVWSSFFTPDVDFWSVALTRLFMGIGISCFFLPLVTINLSGLEGRQIAAASGLSSFMRNLGSSFGTAVMVSLWSHRATLHQSQLVEHITDYSAPTQTALDTLAGLGLPHQGALLWINNQIQVQAYLLATNDTMLLSGLMMLSLTLLIWWAKPPFTLKRAGR